jgi:hypothetical protein
MQAAPTLVTLVLMLVYAVVGESLSPSSSLGDWIDVFILREDAERFIEKIRDGDPRLASFLRIEERGGGRAELTAPDSIS